MVIIIGAGLSGLLTGYRLKKQGIPFKILEARNRVGGRVNTVYGSMDTAVEMGATWFTPQHKHLKRLLEELGVGYFEQYMDSTLFYEASPSAPAQSMAMPQQPPSYRIEGGSSHLIQSLLQQLDVEDVILNQSVLEIKFKKNRVQVIANKAFEGSKVVLAIPPKLWSKKILFEPKLPNNVMDVATETQTWMEESIKIALIYERPFWGKGLGSGTLFSNAGPITEFYDHCNPDRTKYALCGFINSQFKSLSQADRRAAVIDQVSRVYGAQALGFIDYKECAWSEEEHTFEASNDVLQPHQNNGNPIFNAPLFNNRLFISSAEAALEFPGYMEGAVYAGEQTAEKIINS
jgi:monoamine oxidase